MRVLAGPGTGKTETLARRFAYLLATGRASEEEIVLLTFSRRAAADVRARVEAHLGRSHGALRIKTFHSFCLALLRDNAALAGLSPAFQVLSAFKGWLVARLACRRCSLPGPLERGKQSFAFLTEAQSLIETLKQCGISAPAFEAAVRAEPCPPELRALAAIYSRFEEILRDIGTLDLCDVVSKAAELLESARDHPRLLQIRYLLVDEYQDTNPMQSRLLRALALRVGRGKDGRPNLCVIGDPDQSIYRFRGTTAENLLRFHETFPLSEGGDVRLNESYRSVPEVLEVARALNRLYRDGEAPIPGARRARAGEDAVQTVSEDTLDNEAFFVVRRIVALLADEAARPRFNPGDIAILCRSVETSARSIEMALRGYGIPHDVAGAAGFFRHPLVRLAVSAVHYLAGKDPEAALARVLASRSLGLDSRRLRQCRSRAREAGLPMPLGYFRFQDAFQTAPERQALTRFLTEADRLRELAATMTLDEVVYEVFRLTRVFEHLSRADAEARAAARSVARFHAMAREYEEIARFEGRGDDGRPLLHRFADDIDQAARRFADETEAEADAGASGADAVRILTVHQSKGLEFRAVFVVGLNEGVFPVPAKDGLLVKRSDLVPLLRKLTADPLPWPETREEHLREERRLAFVAATRAKDRLFLSRAMRDDAELTPSTLFLTASAALPERARLERPYAKGASEIASLSEALTRHEVEVFLRRLVTEAPNRDLLAERLSSLNETLPEGARIDLPYVRGALLYRRRDDGRVSLPDRLSLSATSLRTFLECPRKFFYRYLLSVKMKETFRASLGTFLHAILEIFHRRHSTLDPKLAKAYERELHEIVDSHFSETREHFPSLTEADTALAIARQLVPAYVAEECGRAEGRKVIAVEERIAFEIAGQTIEAKIDRVDQGPQGIEIVDYKTTPDPKAKLETALKREFLPEDDEKQATNFQLPLYWFALDRRRSISASALTVYYLRRDTPDGPALKRARLAIAREPGAKSVTEKELDLAFNRIVATIGRIREGDFRPDPAEPAQCRDRCEFYDICYLRS